MPRVRIIVPDALLQVAATTAQERGTSMDELFAEAISRYVASTAGASPGSLRSNIAIPRSSPTLAIEIPDEVYQGANVVAKRLGKRREVLYADALAKHLALTSSSSESALDRGHDLPAGAWSPKTSSE